jgi:hypothetical protein
VDSPKTSDVVFQPSLALRTEFRAENETWFRASYAYKPMNTPVVGYSYALQTLPTTTVMQASVEPQFNYHHILTLESQLKAGSWAIVPSLTYDAPQLKAVPIEWIAQNMSPSLLGSLTFTWRPEGSKRELIYGGIFYDWSDFPPDRGENAQGETQFDLRPLWLSAFRFGFDRSHERPGGRELGYGIEGTVDPRQNGGILLSQVRYKWDRHWQTRAHMDVIGVFSEASNSFSASFIQTYHANSTLGLDVSYVY